MKIPETYEEFLKTPDEELIQIAEMKKTLEESQRLVLFSLKAIDDFAEKDKLISEEKRKSAKSQWKRYCE